MFPWQNHEMSGCQATTVHIDISMELWWKLSICFFFFNLVLEVGFYTYQRFSIAVFTSLLSRRWRCCEPLCSTVIRLDLRLAGARQEERLAAHFPLQPVEMRSLHNIYPRNNDVWFDSLLGVSVQRLLICCCCCCRRHIETPDRTYIHREGKKGGLRSLFMDDARLVYFCTRPFRWKAAVLHCR